MARFFRLPLSAVALLVALLQFAEPATTGCAPWGSGMVDSLLEVGVGCHEHPIAYTISKLAQNVHSRARRKGVGSGKWRGSSGCPHLELWGVPAESAVAGVTFG